MGILYRPEIDGLRAVAVVPVVAFHAGVPGFSGGYVGVDVFFVISGFLITSILWRELQDGAFTFRGFYIRRARRILPMLYLVLAATLTAGYALLAPFELRTLSESALSVLGFASNFYFWTQSGYFGPTADQLPLLHTWSVSVEEQFYLLFPALLVAVHRFARAFALVVMGALLLAAFVASGLASQHFPTAGFYLLPTRAWELLLGAMLALTPAASTPRIVGAIGMLAGLAMIAAAVMLFDAGANTPGWPAALPCVGAALAIWCGASAGVSRFVLDNPIAVGVGRISYSMYLWHWPLLIFMPAQIGARGALSPAVLAGYLAVLLTLSALSYFVIEQPFRRGFRFKVPIRPLAWGATASALLGVSLAGAATGGFPERLAPVRQRLAAYAEYHRTTYPQFARCFVSIDRGVGQYDAARCIATNATPSILVWGDSAAAFQMYGWRKAASAHGLAVSEATMSACRPLLHEHPNQNCTEFNRFVRDTIRTTRPTVVVLSARWNAEEMGGRNNGRSIVGEVVALARALRQEGVRVVVVGPPVQYRGPLPAILIRSQQTNFAAFDTSPVLDPNAMAFERRMRAAFRASADIPYISVYDALCAGPRCVVMNGNAPMTWDNHHMTAEGAEYLAERTFHIIETEAHGS